MKGEGESNTAVDRVMEQFQSVANKTSNIEHRTSSIEMHIEPDTLPTGHAGIAARLKKGPTIHSSVWIVAGATVIGDVTLEEESSVWYRALLRGDVNRIIAGPRSNVHDNACVHLVTAYP